MMSIAIDDKPWPQGALSLVWVPAKKAKEVSDELRVRVSSLEGLMPIAQKISPAMYDNWNTLQPA